MNDIQLPDIGENTAFEIHSDNNVSQLSHQFLLNKINNFSSENNMKYSNVVNSAQFIYPINSTLGFLGTLNTKSYSIFPGSYNFNNILKMIEINRSKHLICEEGLLEISLSEEKLKQVLHVTEQVNNICVFGSGENVNEYELRNLKEIFPNAEVNFYNDKTFSKI